MTAGGASYVCHFGTASPTIFDFPDAPPLFVLYNLYAICVAVLLLAMTLSAYFCRKKYLPLMRHSCGMQMGYHFTHIGHLGFEFR